MGFDAILEGLCPNCGALLERREDCGWCPTCGVGHSLTMSGDEGEYRLHLEIKDSFTAPANGLLKFGGGGRATFIQKVNHTDAEG